MKPFDVVLVPFPFADLSSTKKRPCLVLGSFSPRSFGEHVVVAMITSKVEKLKFPHDVVIKEFEEAGLPVPSLLRLGKIVTLEKRLVLKKLGALQGVDISAVRAEFKKLFEKCL